jgi:redox-sensitive bicupin YhaK (pirin superfamily)
MNKKVKYLVPVTEIDMGGFPVKQAIPTQKIDQVDPFLLLHHARTKYSALRPANHQGIGPHPHRGFSPVTFVIAGEVHHRDSWGHNQIAKKGEVQWMHAGAGIIHSERPSQALVEGGEIQEIVQLWINTPAERKMIPPEYTYLALKDIPGFNSEDGKIRNKLIAGNYGSLKSKINSQSEALVIWGEGSKDGEQRYEIPSGFNAMLYQVKGKSHLKGYGKIETEYLVIFNMEGDAIELSILEDDSQFLLLCGKPLEEEVSKNGPFVMNTQTEILEAMRDYQMGKMGVLIE